MFRAKKRGLRSIRTTFIILIIVFLTPLITAVIVNKYFSVAPIYPKYDEVIEISKSSRNGYIYLKSADVIAKRIYNNFLHSNFISYPALKTGKTYTFNYQTPNKIPPYINFIALLDIYKENIKLGDLKDALASLRRPFDKKDTSITSEISQSKGNLTQKISGQNGEYEFLKSSEEVLQNLKKANQSEFLIKYPFDDKQTFPVDMVLSWDIISVALVNCVINFEEGNYTKAMEWLETITDLSLRCYENSFGYSSIVDIIALLYANLLTIDYLPDWVYDDILCMLYRAKDKLTQISFGKKFELILLMLEHKFRVGEEGQRMTRTERLWATFANYRTISKMIEENFNLFMKTSWDDVENSITNQREGFMGKLKEIKTSVFYQYPSMLWLLSSGEAIRRGLISRNKSLNAIYAGILFTLAKEYKIKNGKMPASLQEVLKEKISDEEIKWFESHSEIVFQPQKITVLLASTEFHKLAEFRKINKISTSLGGFGDELIEMTLE